MYQWPGKKPSSTSPKRESTDVKKLRVMSQQEQLEEQLAARERQQGSPPPVRETEQGLPPPPAFHWNVSEIPVENPFSPGQVEAEPKPPPFSLFGSSSPVPYYGPPSLSHSKVLPASEQMVEPQPVFETTANSNVSEANSNVPTGEVNVESKAPSAPPSLNATKAFLNKNKREMMKHLILTRPSEWKSYLDNLTQEGVQKLSESSGLNSTIQQGLLEAYKQDTGSSIDAETNVKPPQKQQHKHYGEYWDFGEQNTHSHFRKHGNEHNFSDALQYRDAEHMTQSALQFIESKGVVIASQGEKTIYAKLDQVGEKKVATLAVTAPDKKGKAKFKTYYHFTDETARNHGYRDIFHELKEKTGLEKGNFG